MADDLDELIAALPAGRVITDPDIVDAYRRDETAAVAPGQPRCVVSARSTDEVVATMRWASEHGVPVVPRGGGSGLAGGAAGIDGCVLLSLARMTAILELDPVNELAVAEAGVINADLDRAAAAHGLMYPPDPSSYEISTIGGNLATNAGGLRCVKYGVTRDAVLGLEVVLADGRVLRTGRRTIKGVAGYDLTSLFVGSEGTLGVITSATLRLRPRPAAPPTTVAASFPSFGAAARAVTAILQARLQPSLLELMDRATLRAIDDWKHLGFGDDVQALLIAQDDTEDAARRAGIMRDACLEHGASLADVSDQRGRVAAAPRHPPDGLPGHRAAGRQPGRGRVRAPLPAAGHGRADRAGRRPARGADRHGRPRRGRQPAPGLHLRPGAGRSRRCRTACGRPRTRCSAPRSSWAAR